MIRLLGLLTLLAAWTPQAYGDVTLTVLPIEGGAQRDIDFGNARSLGPRGEAEPGAVVRQVKLTVTSSSAGRYQVLQRINAPWVNPAGREFPLDAVRFFVKESAGKGDVRFPNPVPLTTGEQEIYLSDSTGSDAELLITYTTQAPTGQMVGRYRTTVTYRVVSQ